LNLPIARETEGLNAEIRTPISPHSFAYLKANFTKKEIQMLKKKKSVTSYKETTFLLNGQIRDFSKETSTSME